MFRSHAIACQHLGLKIGLTVFAIFLGPSGKIQGYNLKFGHYYFNIAS